MRIRNGLSVYSTKDAVRKVLLGLLGIGAAAALVWAITASPPARADTPSVQGWPSEVALPAGRKLVSAGWLCHQACEPWHLTRSMRTGEAAETYVFTNGRERIVYKESASSGR